MNVNQITKKFSQGITWNALFYIFRKALSTLFTILLFQKLSARYFAIWANINSFIFLILLWLDFGFRKSLPRFCPVFAKNKDCMKRFIHSIVRFQATVLILAVPILIIVTRSIAIRLHIDDVIELLYFGCALFFLEGIIAVMRLIYHSYFWQRQCNSLMSVIITIKTTLLMLLLLYDYTHVTFLKIIFTAEIIAGSITITILLLMLRYLYKDKNYPGTQTLNFAKTGKAFLVHSGIMWGNNNLKSLSERNFMMLILTHMLGPVQANLFKIANDSALLFQRVVKKTIGTTDTSLLSHVQTLPEHQKIVPIIFGKLLYKIATFCLPLLGLFFIFIFNFGYIFEDRFIYHIFFMITIFYLTEAIFSPYERLLEVKRKYLALFISYLPYIGILISFFLFDVIGYLGTLKTVVTIHLGRLICIFLMAFYVRYRYRIKFPFKEVARVTLLIIAMVFCVSMIIQAAFPAFTT